VCYSKAFFLFIAGVLRLVYLVGLNGLNLWRHKDMAVCQKENFYWMDLAKRSICLGNFIALYRSVLDYRAGYW
jgi:hypothetical protein